MWMSMSFGWLRHMHRTDGSAFRVAPTGGLARFSDGKANAAVLVDVPGGL